MLEARLHQAFLYVALRSLFSEGVWKKFFFSNSGMHVGGLGFACTIFQ
jgi:hypothetical protein